MMNTYTVPVMEYMTGMRRIGAKYIQRFGVPGNYRYVYQTKKFARLSRKIKAVYGRIVKRSDLFLKQAQLKYGATHLTVKTKSWHQAIITLTGDRGTFDLIADLPNKRITGYRTKATHRVGRLSTVNSRLRKKGVLRYR